MKQLLELDFCLYKLISLRNIENIHKSLCLSSFYIYSFMLRPASDWAPREGGHSDHAAPREGGHPEPREEEHPDHAANAKFKIQNEKF